MSKVNQSPLAMNAPLGKPLGVRLGIVSILISEDVHIRARAEGILKDFEKLFLGHQEHHVPEKGIILCVAVMATTNELGSLTGKLGMVPGIRVKSTLLD